MFRAVRTWMREWRTVRVAFCDREGAVRGAEEADCFYYEAEKARKEWSVGVEGVGWDGTGETGE
jgi:hypothetical protein